MSVWYLEITKGPTKGDRIDLKAGLTLGRKKAHINLNDSKASSIHAQIEQSADGVFSVVDLNSSNGTKLNGKLSSKITLVPGLEFQIGSTFFKVHGEALDKPVAEFTATTELPPIPDEPLEFNQEVLLEDEDETSPGLQLNNGGSSPQIESIIKASLTTYDDEDSIESDFTNSNLQPITPTQASPTNDELIEMEPLEWKELIIQTLEKVPISSTSKPVAAFENVVMINIFRGPQAGTTWTLGYGPRYIGSSTLGTSLVGFDLPDICFELIPTEEGTMFKTSHSSKVLLNSKSTSSEIVNAGDVIIIGDTHLEIHFII